MVSCIWWTGAANESTTAPPAGGRQAGHGRAGDGGAGSRVLRAPLEHRSALWTWLATSSRTRRARRIGLAGHARLTFYNANLDGTGQWVTMNIASVINHQQTLRYQYAPPPPRRSSWPPRRHRASRFRSAARRVTQTISVPDGSDESRRGGIGEWAGGPRFSTSSSRCRRTKERWCTCSATAWRNGRDEHGSPELLGYFAIVAKGGRDHNSCRST